MRGAHIAWGVVWLVATIGTLVGITDVRIADRVAYLPWFFLFIAMTVRDFSLAVVADEEK